MGDPSRFCARVITTSWVPSACTKSCAVWPMRRSGGARPTRARMGRLRNASVMVRGGQVPSSRPPSTTRSTDNKPCLQQSEDLDAAMRRAGGRTEILLFGQCGEEGRIIDKPPLQRLVFLRADFRHFEIVEKRRQRLDGRIATLAFVVGWRSAKCLDGTTVMFGQRDEVERALAVIRR